MNSGTTHHSESSIWGSSLVGWRQLVVSRLLQGVVAASVACIASAQGMTIRFINATETSGIRHATVYGDEGRNRYLVETTGTGAALIDLNEDGFLDAILVNGSRFGMENSPPTRTFRNRGDGTFTDVTTESGLQFRGWGQAICAGDYDNDGRVDLFLTGWQTTALFRNLGGFRFRNMTEGAHLVQARSRWNTGCTFIDYDRDGDLDLFVVNYIDFDPEKVPLPETGLCLFKGLTVACGPSGLPGAKNILYRNLGNGTFEDVSAASGVEDANGSYGLGTVVLDFDADGWPDLYVANDSTPSALYRNNRDGTFTDVGIETGAAYSIDGAPQAGMGVATGDVDGDGRVDLFKTNFDDDTANLYRNVGEEGFEDIAHLSDIGRNRSYLGWGAGLVDFDNDGWLDIFQVNGHVYPEVDRLDVSSSRYRQSKLVYRNAGEGRFRDVTKQAGTALSSPEASRGAAFGDIDNDGDVDVLVNNVNSPATLFRNDSPVRGWISVIARNRNGAPALGAKVQCRTDGRSQSQSVQSGSGYFSQNQMRVHFGLSDHSSVDEILVQWPDGTSDRFERLAANRIWILRQGAAPQILGPSLQ